MSDDTTSSEAQTGEDAACEHCGGSGSVEVPLEDGNEMPCPKCRGSGRVALSSPVVPAEASGPAAGDAGARERLFDAIFAIVEKYNLPFSNANARRPKDHQIGDLCGDIERAVLAAGYLSPSTPPPAELLAKLEEITRRHRQASPHIRERQTWKDQDWLIAQLRAHLAQVDAAKGEAKG